MGVTLAPTVIQWCNQRMSAEPRRSRTDRSRPWRIVLAACGGVWAAVLLPLPATVWGVTQWAWVVDYPVYVWARQWAADTYITFGALSSLSFLAVGIALFPDLRRARWGGIVMAWLIILGAPMTALSYLNTPVTAPLHFLWGWEAYVLLGVGAGGIAAAATAGPRWGIGVRTILGLTFLFVVVGTIGLGYWPHGSLVVLALEAVAVIAAAPRDAAFAAADDSTPPPDAAQQQRPTPTR